MATALRRTKRQGAAVPVIPNIRRALRVHNRSMEVIQMTEQSKSNQMAVPEAKAAMNRFKEEVASEVCVPLKVGYNGDLTSAHAGSIGVEMV